MVKTGLVVVSVEKSKPTKYVHRYGELVLTCSDDLGFRILAMIHGLTPPWEVQEFTHKNLGKKRIRSTHFRTVHPDIRWYLHPSTRSVCFNPHSHPSSFINCITISLMLKSINHHSRFVSYHIISCYPFLTDGLILKNDPCFIQFTNPDPSFFHRSSRIHVGDHLLDFLLLRFEAQGSHGHLGVVERDEKSLGVGLNQPPKLGLEK